MKYNKPVSSEELAEYKQYSLKDKISLSEDIINDFYDNKPSDKLFISSSFGKDSVVLIDLVQSQHTKIPIVFANTGVEHPSCVEVSKKYRYVTEVRPYKSAEQVFHDYGFPLPSGKDKSNAIEQIRINIHDGKFNTFRMRQIRGETTGKMRDYSKSQKLVFAPFKISDKCCYWLKEQPINTYMKKTGRTNYYVGMTVEESVHRANTIKKDGFNMTYQSRPLAFWKVHDILEYIKKHKLPLASCYGRITTENGEYKTTIHQRNGCVCCPIGSDFEKPNKFQLLHKYDFESWDYVIHDLGMSEMLDWLGVDYVWREEFD